MNRYATQARVDAQIEEAIHRVMYKAPDKAAQCEHGKINNTILETMRELIEVCPEGRELDLALTHIWEARNAAHGAIALAKATLPTDDDNLVGSSSS